MRTGAGERFLDALKSAFLDDRLTTDGLGERVAIAQRADTVDELDAALRDL